MKKIITISLLLFSFCSMGQVPNSTWKIDTVQRVWVTAPLRILIPKDSICLTKWRKIIEYYLPEEKDKIFRECQKRK